MSFYIFIPSPSVIDREGIFLYIRLDLSVKIVLKSLKHLVVSKKMTTFAVEIKNILGDNLKTIQLWHELSICIKRMVRDTIFQTILISTKMVASRA
jgi:protein associated with RNAse G/E